jgi:proton-dependent oligopeptide transporter, POT family
VFAGVAVGWTVFEQKGSAWVFQARQMDRAVLGHQLSPAQLQALAPLFAAALLPLLARGGVRGTRLRRVTVGMFATALSFAVAAVVQVLIDAGRAPHALWQIPQYLLLGAGEVLVAVTALELGFAQAPRAMRSTVISIWFVTMSAGNLLAVLVTRVLRLEGAAWFWFFAAVMVAVALAFRAIARGWRVAPEDEIVAE